ncbi:FAD-binding and (Fe-S)-binding domain-containing protein [Streptomyces sp. H10-C2]|uniref:FAD-binding and (Fe-S)-binding domain-containing protein n=1 Tax=unclassified Streptomyces TaxID=2593676 RepID=UPI0024BB4F10|nr:MULTISPECIES: FAD-binding and (Fe-S)-binding domain-containing protein [unclassified Streptomyces]MDJ0345207.1 FAD-binding and (Fe-S)-binding domain-containing protein [Streptomyces sp. PH10-H1]MDJ0374436.1 FAD-binding and (Fe-S)-binding domain-containing protein [Streptomyces sp. H10-C2]
MDLEQAMRTAVRGSVAFDAGARALVTMDASNYRRVPLGVVAPRDADDVAAALAVCREYGVPVVPRGGGTSIAGQATGVGVVLDFTRHMRTIEHLDPEACTAVVQPGVVLDDLRAAAAAHGLTFGPDPSTHSRCTLGGMIGNNACGSHSVAWGTTADNVHELEVLTYGGEHARLGRGLPGPLHDRTAAFADERLALLRTGFPDLPRRISGYALDRLLPEHGRDLARAFTGSEGTLGVLTRATVRLVETPGARALAVLGYEDESAAADAAHLLLPHHPLTVEGMAADLVGAAARDSLPRGVAWLFVETGGATAAEARSRAEELCRRAAADGATGRTVVTDPAAQRALWRIREDAAGTATRMPDGSEAWPGWEDCAVPPARLGAYLREFRALLGEHGLRGSPYGHFGDGCVHVRIDFDLLTPHGIARFRRFSEETADLVVAHGGSLSGEHGDGQARAELLPKMYGPELVALFGVFKDLWDPAGGMNPGMLVRPAPMDTNLRFDVLPSRASHPVDVEFTYPGDGGDFTAAVRRCVGVAKCRTAAPPASSGAGGGGGGDSVMCPSYRVTGEERHSTRGRARLLHEMLAGEIIKDGWRSEEVRDALDLCLSCKGCRSDCPVEVDMATYKAEFLHHHYEGRLRPRSHYSMGWLPVWLRAAAPFARVLNVMARGPLAGPAKRAVGIAAERGIPALAHEPFRRWWRRRGDRRAVAGSHVPGPTVAGPTVAGPGLAAPAVAGPAVVLWPDTFTNYLSPQVGQAAVKVLEAAGLRVVLPPKAVCCGLTWVSTGQLDRARTVMRRTVDALAPALDAGLPIVVLEPSCGAALRADLPELLGSADPRAARLAASVRTFAQVLEELAPGWVPPRLDRAVVGQTHCHQHAVLGDAAERRLRERAGLNGALAGGCCGLAGNFGFERGHYDVSVACAEEQLLPAVRKAPAGAAVLADGFSCRTQLADLAGTPGRHLAELLAEALPAD